MTDAFALLHGSSVYREGTDEEDVESDGSCADHDDYSCNGEDGGVWVVKGRKKTEKTGSVTCTEEMGVGAQLGSRLLHVVPIITFGVMKALQQATNKLGQSGHARYRSFKFGSISEDVCDLAVGYTSNNADAVSQAVLKS